MGKAARGFTAAPLALVLAACGTGRGGPPDSGEDADGDSGECVLTRDCTPFAWSCQDGEPVECTASGDGWAPRDPCPPGQTCNPDTGWCECGSCEIAVAGSCVRAGAECPAGWTDDGECGCEPIQDACSTSEIAAIGGGCVPVGPLSECGTGRWGSIPTDPDTIYVDASYTAGGSDGSELRPYTTIGEAVAAADPAAPRSIAVAAGTYVEDVVLDRPVALHGRCIAMVVINPEGTGSALSIMAGGASARSLTVDALHRSQFGILVEGCSSAALVEDVAVRGARDVGIMGRDSDAVLRRVSVASTGSSAASHGDGIHFRRVTGTRCSLDVENADLLSTTGCGIRVEGCDLAVRDSRVRHASWEGIRVDAVAEPLGVSVTGCHVSETTGMGIAITYLGDLPTADGPVVSRNVVTDIAFEPAYETVAGIFVQFGTGTCEISENLVADSDTGGIAVSGPSMDVRDNRIEGVTREGIIAASGESSTVSGNTIDGAVNGAILMDTIGSSAVERNAVRNAVPDADGYVAGIGLYRSGAATIGRNAVRSTVMGIVAEIMSGTVLVESNGVLAGFVGIAFQAMDPGTSAIATSNRIVDAPYGVYAGDSDAVIVSDNLVGPIRSFWPGDMNESFGMIFGGVEDLEASGNEVVLDLSAVDDRMSAGIVAADVSGVISGNRVAGDVMAGIMYQPLDADPVRDVSILDNTVVGAGGVGISIDDTLPGSTYAISGNRVAGSSDENWYDGLTYGDGINLRDCDPLTTITVTNNLLFANDRTGMLVSGSVVSASGNEIAGNSIAMAWQNGALVDLGENAVYCNGSDQPWIDQGLAVPDPPDIDMPEI